MSEEIDEPWYCIDYDDNDRNMTTEILFTDRESLKILSDQLRDFLDDPSGEQECHIEYGVTQDLTDTPVQKVRFVDRSLYKGEVEKRTANEMSGGCLLIGVISVFISITLAVYLFVF